MKDRPPATRGSSVQQDWRSRLPEEKAAVYCRHQQDLESRYDMFSVSLNEAIGLGCEGCVAQSLKALAMAADLCKLLTQPLEGLLRALHEHSKHYGTIPNVAPLDPGNFVGHRAQRSARFSGLLNLVLLSQRLQFLQKVSAIQEMVEDSDKDFHDAAKELADLAPTRPNPLWDELARGHYDLNSCLRETFVLLKSFLMVLPFSELEAFQVAMQSQCQPSKDQPLGWLVTIGNRRMAAFAGK